MLENEILPEWLSQNLPEWALEGFNYVTGIWNEGAYGFTYGQIFTIVAIILFSLIIRGLF